MYYNEGVGMSVLQVASTPFSFIDNEDSNSSQSWARIGSAALATGR